MGRIVPWLLALAATLSAVPASAQFPDRPLRIVVPYAAGGGIDITARGVAKGLGEALNQAVVVENKPGGNSVIGANAVAKSPADGYTLLFTSGSTVSVLPHITRSLPFDATRDLIPVGKIAKLPFYLVVNSKVPAKDLKEFIALAKASPGALTYASAGSGTGAHLGFELLKKSADLNVQHVPYKATNEALPDLLTGRVTSMMADLTTVQRYIADGSLRVLGVTTKERAAAMPAVPSIAEQGVADFDLELWVGLFAPAGTPPAVVARLNTGLREGLQTRSAAAVFASGGWIIDPSTPRQLGALAAAESARWADMAKAGILKVD